MLGILVYYLWWALRIYFYIIIASILMSWVPEIRNTKIGQAIDRIANPFMRIFRGLIVIGMFDLTPMIGIFLYQLGLNQLIKMAQILVAQGL